VCVCVCVCVCVYLNLWRAAVSGFVPSSAQNIESWPDNGKGICYNDTTYNNDKGICYTNTQKK